MLILVLNYRFRIDVSSIIREQWNFITAHPDTWSNTLSNYVKSGKIVKKLQMHMKVEWDWQSLEYALRALVRRCARSLTVRQPAATHPAAQHRLPL